MYSFYQSKLETTGNLTSVLPQPSAVLGVFVHGKVFDIVPSVTPSLIMDERERLLLKVLLVLLFIYWSLQIIKKKVKNKKEQEKHNKKQRQPDYIIMLEKGGKGDVCVKRKKTLTFREEVEVKVIPPKDHYSDCHHLLWMGIEEMQALAEKNYQEVELEESEDLRRGMKQEITPNQVANLTSIQESKESSDNSDGECSCGCCILILTFVESISHFIIIISSYSS